MTVAFNLIDEPWIPVIDLGGRATEVGLRQALEQAHLLAGVAAPTGLESASILRLLLAVLHRTHDTSSGEAWAALWKGGRFDGGALTRYWEAWARRFDLFDAERPFYQMREERKKAVSTASFFPGLAASDHYNHPVQLDERALTPAEAARMVLVAQAFGLSGGCMPSERLSFKASPCVAGMTFFVEGDTLFQTLCCNLLRYDESNPSDKLFWTEKDRPNWEADDPYELREQPYGYLDYLTWPSRGLKLKPEVLDGRVVVRSYIDYVGVAPPSVLDMFKFYRRDEKAKNASGYIALYLNVDKATWRSSSTILRLHNDKMLPPKALNWLAVQRRNGALQFPRSRLTSYGVVVENQTKVVIMRRESLPLPLAYLDQSSDLDERMDLLARLDSALLQAEQIAGALREATFQLAREIYPRPGASKDEKLSTDQRNMIKRVASSLSTEAIFWSELERPFSQLVIDLAEAGTPEGIQERWLAETLAAGRAALAAAVDRAGQYPKALKAAVLAKRSFEWSLRKAGIGVDISQGEKREATTL